MDNSFLMMSSRPIFTSLKGSLHLSCIARYYGGFGSFRLFASRPYTSSTNWKNALPVPLSRSISSSTALRNSSPQFISAVEALKKLEKSPGNEVKLELYALYKQATLGPNGTPRPGMFDIVGKAKWDAWKGLGALTQDEASKKYIAVVSSLTQASSSSASVAGGGTKGGASTASSSATVLTSTSGAIRTLTLNRPERRNALTSEMYADIVTALTAAAEDPAVKVVVMTGAGGFYCSGNDLGNFAEGLSGGGKGALEALASQGRATLHKFVDRFITFPKILVVALNGPAIGIAVTTLPLADFVYASHKATLHAPLTALGQSPEGCASLTFPQTMGAARSSDLLLRGRKITASMACEWGLVNQVFEDESFEKGVANAVSELAALPPQSLLLSKRLIRNEAVIAAQKAANDAECDLIAKRWVSEECMEAVIKFLSKAKKGGATAGV